MPPGTYEANGGHSIPNPAVDFNGCAAAAGDRQMHEFSALAEEFNDRRLDDPVRCEAFKAAVRA